MRHSYLSLIIVAVLSVSSAEAGGPLLDSTSDEFAPVSVNARDYLGQLKISKSRASFADLRGDMILEDGGIPAELGDPHLSGTHVYRIRNADEFYKQNRTRDGYCGEEVYWLGIRPLALPPGYRFPAGTIQVIFFAEKSLAKLRLGSVCSSNAYLLHNPAAGARTPI